MSPRQLTATAIRSETPKRNRRKKFLDTVTQKNATVRLQLEQHYEQQVEDTMARELEAGAVALFRAPYFISWMLCRFV